MNEHKTLWGICNGRPCYSEEEWVLAKRHGVTINTDDELIAFAERVTSNWYYAGWHRTFTTYYLGDYALDEPRRSLTRAEYNRLRELQKEAQAAEKAADDAREWKLIGTYCYADNSVEEHYRDKDGNEKTVMVVWPHGD